MDQEHEESWCIRISNKLLTAQVKPVLQVMLYQLSYEATHWERGQFIQFISSRAVKGCEVYEIIHNCTAVVEESEE